MRCSACHDYIINRNIFFYHLLYVSHAQVYMPIASLDLEICATLNDFVYVTKSIGGTV